MLVEAARADGRQHRLFVADPNSSIRYLIDTGAEISVLPKTFAGKTKSLPPTKTTLFAANNTAIHTYGEKLMVLDLKLRTTFKWIFVIADIEKPIIGADFLPLVDSMTKLSAHGSLLPCGNNAITTVAKISTYHNLLAQCPEITRAPPPVSNIPNPVAHHIFTTGPPNAEKPRRLAPDKLKAAKTEFQYMLDQAWCRPSSSPWASPFHLVPKKAPGECRAFLGTRWSGWWGLPKTERSDNSRWVPNPPHPEFRESARRQARPSSPQST